MRAQGCLATSWLETKIALQLLNNPRHGLIGWKRTVGLAL